MKYKIMIQTVPMLQFDSIFHFCDTIFDNEDDAKNFRNNLLLKDIIIVGDDDFILQKCIVDIKIVEINN